MEIMRGDMPAKPPKGCPTGIAPGWSVVYFDSPEALDAMARYSGIDAFDAWNPQHICGGAVISARIVLMLSREATKDDELFEARLAHEYAHTHSYTHPPDAPRKWLDPQGKPVD